MKSLKQIPDGIKWLIGLVGAIISFVLLIQENVYLGVTILVFFLYLGISVVLIFLLTVKKKKEGIKPDLSLKFVVKSRISW